MRNDGIHSFDENNYLDVTEPYDDHKVQLVNGNDSESGHKRTIYSVEADTDYGGAESESYENLTETILLTRDDLVVFEDVATTMNNIINNQNKYQIKPLLNLDTIINNRTNSNESYQKVFLAFIVNSYTLNVTTEDNAGNISTITYKIDLTYNSMEAQ